MALALLPWLLIAALTAMRLVYAGVLDLRTDEAYYWTWSKESALSFLDHPPGIAWLIRFGTAIFGDTRLGVRFGGIVAMLVTQLLLADIVRRVTHDVRAVIFAVLLPEAALYYGLLMAKVAPDTAMIPCAVAMLWSLVRLHESGNPRWWLAAGLFAGLALLSKFTAIMLLPAVARVRAGAGLAAALAAQPLAVSGGADCGDRVSAGADLECGARLGVVPLPVRARGRDPSIFVPHRRRIHRASIRSRRLRAAAGGAVRRDADRPGAAIAHREPVAILLSTAVLVPFLYFLWKSLTLRVGDTWPMFLWPAGFAATAINLVMLPREGWPDWIVKIDILVGEGGRHLRHRLRGRRVLLLCRRALEFDRQDRSRRRRGRL